MGITLLPYSNSSSGSSSSSSSSSSFSQSIQNLPAPTSIGSCTCQYALEGAQVENVQEIVPVKPFEIRLTKNAIKLPIVSGSISFTWSGNKYVDYMGGIYRNPDPATGVGTLAGSVDYLTGIVTLDVYDGGDNTFEIHSAAWRLGNQGLTELNFRTPGVPLRPGSFTVAGVTREGERVSATADFEGNISGNHITGFVDHATGVVSIGFGDLIDDNPSYHDEDWYNPALVKDGKVWKPLSVYADSLTYACVIYNYIPLSASLLGLNPVRLPSDGRVPIVKPGDVVVIHNTAPLTVEQAPTAGQIINLPRVASSVEVYDSSPVPRRVPSNWYTFNEGDQSLKFSEESELLNFSTYTLPLTIMHKVEDMVMVSETSINGIITLAQGVVNSYPVENTKVSSAIMIGDMQARYTGLFDQKTWKNEFSDDLNGDPATATYNEIDYPIRVSNSAAVTERWAIVFDSQEHFTIHGEKRGVIGEGYTTQDCQPLNAITRLPYFTIDLRGWGSGWAAGNVLRFNTVGAVAAAWAVRTTLQGPSQMPYDWFTILPRGDSK